MNDRNFAPLNLKEHRFKDGSTVLNASANAEKLIEWISDNKNERGYINLKISPRKTPGKYGDTHFAYLDTWKPQEKEAGDDSMPF